MGRRNLAFRPAEILGLLGQGLSAVQVARKVGCTAAHVYGLRAAAAKARGVELVRGRTADESRALEVLQEDGATIAEAAEFAGVSVERVLRMVGDVGSGRPSPERAASLAREGLTADQISRALGVPGRTVYRWLANVRAAEKSAGRKPPPPWAFVLRWPRGPFTPETKCRCDVDPIPRGSAFVCPVCHATGFDDHPDMKRPAVASRAEPKRRRKRIKVIWSQQAMEDAAKLKAASRTLTRRERRYLKYGESEAARARGLYARLAGSDDPNQFERDGESLYRLYGSGGDWAGRIVAHHSGA